MTTPDLPSPIALEEIFRVAAELPAAERAAYLETACEGRPEMRARIERMREVGGIAAFLKQGSDETVPAEIETELAQRKPGEDGERIGHYKLLQQIGEGGFGVVWMAEQIEPVRRRVALKILKPGMDTKEVIARFEQERQALAMMDHPNIAKVFDAGTTPAGRPFFVMELVKGMPITKYCDEAGLGTRERLALFGDVCSAINHAHQKGVIHRDIKPSNVMVTLHGDKPVVKVIDFGIAKATQGRLTDKTIFTRFEQFIGTPVYMSPEQASMSGLDVDTRSDIYALGVLLYELLTGKPPFDAKSLASAGYEEMRRIIREVEPPKPSSRLSTVAGEERLTLAKARHIDPAKVSRLVEPDLDWIVMKAIEKDRARRYETASGLALDLQRYLQNEPVLARPPSFGYKAGKFVRKYKRGVIAAAAVLLALLAGLVASTVLYLEKRDAWASESVQRQKAERLAQSEVAARQEAEAISKYIINIFESSDPERDGRKITVAETLDRAARELDADLASQPLLRDRLQYTLGLTYAALGLSADAIPLLEKSRDFCLATVGPEHRTTLGVALSLATSYRNAERLSEAIKLQEEVVDVSRKVLGPEDTSTIGAIHNLGMYYRDAGRRPEALKMQEEVLVLRRKVLPPEHPDIAGAMQNLAISYFDAGRQADAIRMFEEAFAFFLRVAGPEKPRTLKAMSDLAEIYSFAGRRDDAFKMREKLLELFDKVSGPDHPDTIQAKALLARSYDSAGRPAEALKMLEEVLVLSGTVNGLKHRMTLLTMVFLADSYAQAGREAEALKLREEVLELRKVVLGPGHPDTLAAMHYLVSSYSAAHRRDEAIKLGEEVLELHRKVSGPKHPDMQTLMRNLVASYWGAGRRDEALKLQEEVLALRRKGSGPEHLDTLHAAAALANSYRDANRLPEAEKVADDLLASLDESSHPIEFAAALKLRGGLRVSTRRWKDAAGDYARAAPLNPDDHTVWYRLAPLLLHVGDAESYRKHRQDLLEEFHTTEDVPTMERTARVCLLLPVEGEELEAAGKLADAAARLGKEHEFRSYFQFTDGLAQYRRGQFNEAVSTLRDALFKPGDVALEIDMHSVLEMALHRLHRPAEARASLAKAADQVATKLPSLNSSDLDGTDWSDILITHLLLHEAEALLGELTDKGSPSPPARVPAPGTESTTEGKDPSRKPPVPGTLVPPDAEWKWLHPTDGKDPAEKVPGFHERFFLPAFDDSTWPTGRDSDEPDGGFGYGLSFHGLSIGKPEGMKDRRTAYFRHAFTTGKSHSNLELRCRRDDGIIVYLDGKEILRDNTETGPDAWQLPAKTTIGPGDDSVVQHFSIPGTLAAGKHLLAISVHNTAQPSTDLRLGGVTLLEVNPTSRRK